MWRTFSINFGGMASGNIDLNTDERVAIISGEYLYLWINPQKYEIRAHTFYKKRTEKGSIENYFQ